MAHANCVASKPYGKNALDPIYIKTLTKIKGNCNFVEFHFYLLNLMYCLAGSELFINYGKGFWGYGKTENDGLAPPTRKRKRN